jgi:hypothetical protein
LPKRASEVTGLQKNPVKDDAGFLKLGNPDGWAETNGFLFNPLDKIPTLFRCLGSIGGKTVTTGPSRQVGDLIVYPVSTMFCLWMQRLISLLAAVRERGLLGCGKTR